MNAISIRALWMSIFIAASCNSANRLGTHTLASRSSSLALSTPSGLALQVAEEYSDPTLWLSISNEPSGQNAVLLLLPEHVTVRRHDINEAEHLYLWRPGRLHASQNWLRSGNALQYERDLASGIHLVARVSLQLDGVLVHYEFDNDSDVDFDSVQAVTDPRMLSPLFHDVRLERTYVHESEGFVLLASDMPDRLKMPLKEWLPNRYRISYSWPEEKEHVQTQPDGIKFFNAPNRTDEPVIATVSNNGQWIMATFSRNPGNLWTNPDLTCQHADPEISLAHRSKGIVEEKVLLLRGTLDDVLRKVKEQRDSLR